MARSRKANGGRTVQWIVFDTMREARNQPMGTAEIARAAGLDMSVVIDAVRAMLLRGTLVKAGAGPGVRMTYKLALGARAPIDRRGRHPNSLAALLGEPVADQPAVRDLPRAKPAIELERCWGWMPPYSRDLTVETDERKVQIADPARL